jgi:hypothetical protein
MKFEVVKCQPMESKPGAANPWRATMVKGLFTDDLGEVEMVEVMLFGQRDAFPPVFQTGELLQPVFQVRVNRQTKRPEFVIGALNKPSVSALPKAA